jgi:hypothetical protein
LRRGWNATTLYSHPFDFLSVERVGMSCAGNGQKRRYRGAPMGRIQIAKQTLPKWSCRLPVRSLMNRFRADNRLLVNYHLINRPRFLSGKRGRSSHPGTSVVTDWNQILVAKLVTRLRK